MLINIWEYLLVKMLKLTDSATDVAFRIYRSHTWWHVKILVQYLVFHFWISCSSWGIWDNFLLICLSFQPVHSVIQLVWRDDIFERQDISTVLFQMLRLWSDISQSSFTLVKIFWVICFSYIEVHPMVLSDCSDVHVRWMDVSEL